MKFEWTVSPHYGPTAPMEVSAASFNACTKSLHLHTSVPQIQMQFIFNPDKTPLVGVTCCAHRFSYFINNVKHRKVLHDGSEQLTGCKEASSPHCLTSQSITTWSNRWRKGCHHTPPCHRTNFCPVLYCNFIPTARKKPIQTAAKQHRAFSFRNQLTTSPKNVGKPSE